MDDHERRLTSGTDLWRAGCGGSRTSGSGDGPEKPTRRQGGQGAPVRSHLVGDALDEVRRELWQQLRQLPDDRWAKAFKGSRWALLKNPEDLTDTQAAQLARIRRTRGGIWRAYEMKEQFRAVFAGNLEPAEAIAMLDRWCARAQRSRLPAFVKTARTMRERRGLIVNALEHGISNGRVEGMNTKVRLLVRRAYGFHSATAALALVMLACGPITLTLPHEHPPAQTAA